MLRFGYPVTSPFLNARPTVNGSVPVTPDVSSNEVTCDPLGPVDTVAGGGAFTVKVKVVDRVREPAVPVMVMLEDPAGVEAEVVIVNGDVQFGMQDEEANETVVPDGNPDAERTTGCTAPETVATLTVLVSDWPAVTAWSPPLEIEKSKPGT